jgi:GNAT superfamily N-acetyltransferase
MADREGIQSVSVLYFVRLMDTNDSFNMDIQFRLIRADELSSLLELYKHLNSDEPPLPEAEVLDRVWNDFTTDPKIHCVVAEMDSHLVASCTLIIVPNLTRGARPYGLIENVVTHPDYRKKGIGHSLLRHTLQLAWDKGCYKVMLLTGRKQEETMRFYEKAGFQRGIKTGFVAKPE